MPAHHVIANASDTEPIDHDRTTGPAPDHRKPLLTLGEFKHALGDAIGRNTLYELVRANRIRHVRLGRKLLIPATEVTAFPEREASLD